MAVRSALATIVAKYRNFDPATRQFSQDRTHGEYAELLGVSRPFITQIINGDREPGVDLLRSLSRLFPAAAREIAVALASPEPEPAEAPAIALVS